MRSDPSQYFPESTRQLFAEYGDYPPPPDSAHLENDIAYDDIDIIEEEIGKGGFAVVHHGQIDNQDVALKEPRSDREELGQQFLAEARYWEGLTGEKSPPFIVDCYASGTEPHPWICADYLPKGTLHSYLEDYMETEGTPLPLDVALWMAIIIIRGVEYAHSQGVTHRDLKPDNILLKQEEHKPIASPYPQISDWGLAIIPILADSDDAVLHPYAAPEQLDDARSEVTNQKHGEGIDIYQTGLITHFLLTGEHPVPHPSRIQLHENITHGNIPRPSEQRSSLPDGIDQVIMKAIARNRNNRYENATKFREVLEGVFRSCIDIDEIAMEKVDYFRSATTATGIARPSKGDKPIDMEQIWQCNLRDNPVHSPLTQSNQLYVPMRDRVDVYNLESGIKVTTYEPAHLGEDDSISGITLAGQKLYAATNRGAILSVFEQKRVGKVHADTDAAEFTAPISILESDPQFFVTYRVPDVNTNVTTRVGPNGTEEWEVKTIWSESSHQLPVYLPQQEQLFVPSDNGIVELDTTSGAKHVYDNIIAPETNLVSHRNYLYYGATVGGETSIVCVNTNNEKITWTHSTGSTLPMSGLSVKNDAVVATTKGLCTDHGTIVCCDRSTGSERWKFVFGNQSVSPPVVDQNHVYVGLSLGHDGETLPDYMQDIYCFDLESGTNVFRARTDSEIADSLLPRDDQLLAVTSDASCISFSPG